MMKENCIELFLNRGEEYLRYRADRDIEANRKGLFCLHIQNADGTPVPDAEVRLTQTAADFDFGCNIFMLDQYDEPARNAAYADSWLQLFNTAVVPLYWEGTEPRRDYLRYDSSTPNDVYRRPPADTVVSFCRQHHLRMKGHPLFWHEFVPQWLPDDYAELKPLIAKRFQEIAGRYRDVIPAFDVVNEPSRIWDIHNRENVGGQHKHIVPDDDYCVWMFDLASRLFPASNLILNDAVGASFCQFRGKYSGYYLTIKDLLNRGVRIDTVGLQCHLGDSSFFENVYDAGLLYNILDTYASLGKPLVVSETSIPSLFNGLENQELQARAAEMLYKVCFSHKSLTGLFWWNLPDDGVLCSKRVAPGENLPSTGLLDTAFQPKQAYKLLKKLIRQEWVTNLAVKTEGRATIPLTAFFGTYAVEVATDGKRATLPLHLAAHAARDIYLTLG